jgi:hypothetical protein
MADRWENDERGEGVGDALAFVDGASELLAAMRRPNWVAEQPELHLLPHLELACESLPFRILDARTSDDGAYDVRLGWTGDEAGVGVVRASIFGLLGSIAEPCTYIRQRLTDAEDASPAMLTFEVVTGIVDQMPFKPHGHTLRLTVAASDE